VDGSQTKQGVVVYDLTIDPEIFKDMSPEELALSMRLKRDEPGIRLPIKNIQYNRCPAVAPEIVLKDDDRLRLKLDKKLIDENYKKFLSMPELSSNIVSAQKILDDQRKSFYSDSEKYSVEASLYDGFIDNQDKNKMNQLHSSSSNISSNIKFLDKRLNQLLPLFIARNYPKLMNENIHSIYEEYRQKYFYAGDNNSRAAKYYMKLAELESRDNITSEEKYLIEELKLWGEAIMPSDSDF
jgi:exodeoxyribonuclease-1